MCLVQRRLGGAATGITYKPGGKNTHYGGGDALLGTTIPLHSTLIWESYSGAIYLLLLNASSQGNKIIRSPQGMRILGYMFHHVDCGPNLNSDF
jgi:hypothetical protein